LDIARRPGGGLGTGAGGAGGAAEIARSNASGGPAPSAAKAGRFAPNEGGDRRATSGEINPAATIGRDGRIIIESEGRGDRAVIRSFGRLNRPNPF
jgi:hypothetical protein